MGDNDIKTGLNNMDNKIKQAVNNFRQQNGNENFTNKEMLMYIVQRLDNLPCNEHMTLIQELRGITKTWKWTAGILLTIIIAMIGISKIV